jgi:hypothetical protein
MTYRKPEMEIVKISCEDIITASVPGEIGEGERD